MRVIFGWLKSTAQNQGIRDAQGGAITVVQRFGYRRSYCDLLHEQSLNRPASYGSGASQRSREALEPRGGVLGDLQPPHSTVRLKVVALAFHQPTFDPRMHDVQPHAEALGRSRHGVASIRVAVWK
jgi:hypothetical protein